MTRNQKVSFSWIFLQTILLALMGTFCKLAGETISVWQLLFIQTVLPCFLFVPLLLLKADSIKTKKWGLHAVRVIAGMVGFGGLVVALQFIPVANATLLSCTRTIFIPLIIWAWFGIKVPHKLWTGIGIGFIGVAVMLHPGVGGFLNWGDLIGLISGLGLGLTMVVVRRLNYTETPYHIVAYYTVFGSLIYLVPAIPTWKPMSGQAWVYSILASLCFAGIQFCMIFGFKRGKPSTLAPLIYLAIIWSGIIDWIVWQTTPSWWFVGGGILVIIGGMLCIFLESPAELKAEDGPPPSRFSK